ncbi:MAG: hypothetical protein ACOX9C_07175, partial [Kiritimatiellia bacterium]
MGQHEKTTSQAYHFRSNFVQNDHAAHKEIGDRPEWHYGHGGEVRKRVWDRKTLFRCVVAQAASFNASCSSAVKALQAAGRKCSSNTSGCSQAAGRFPL